MTTASSPLLAYLVFEPYVSLFSVAAGAAAVGGMAFGVRSGSHKVSPWLKGALFPVALTAAFLFFTSSRCCLRSSATNFWPVVAR